MSADSAERDRLIRTLTKELREKNLALFIGAGFSMDSGFVSWSQLLAPIAEELKLDIKREESNLVNLAQYYYNEAGSNRGKLNQLLIDEFSKDAKLGENHQILARLPVQTYWTTNYDKLIETALTESGKVPDVKYTKKQLVYTRPQRDAIVYKMHGDADHPSEAVLIKDDYEKYHVEMQPFLDALTGDLISKAFLFLGFSFTDPNLDYILSRVRVAYSKDQRQHNCILRSVRRDKGEKKADYEYRQRKQELFVQDLLRFGIKAHLVAEYSEITEILRAVEKQYRRDTVFISGAAHDYSPHGKDNANAFVYGLSRDIVKAGLKIVSGFGLGLGGSVITGALDHIYMQGGTLSKEQLVLRPFPQEQAGQRPLKELWTDYRNDMISHAGIALFLFGNKLEGDRTVLSGGMREEYEIAKKKGLFLLPVGATGYMAKELWDEVSENFDNLNGAVHRDIKRRFAHLGDANLSLADIHTHIMAILNLLAR